MKFRTAVDIPGELRALSLERTVIQIDGNRE